MRPVYFGLLLLILALVTVSNSGCLWLAVPSLAYQGYQATEGKKTGTKSAQKSRKAQAKSAHTTHPSDSATDVE